MSIETLAPRTLHFVFVPTHVVQTSENGNICVMYNGVDVKMDIRLFFRSRVMELFQRAGKGRHSNDANNKSREVMLVNLYHTQDPTLQDLRTKWRTFLTTLCKEPYDDVVVKRKGGRGANYDFHVSFQQHGTVIHTLNSEFKHNASSISRLPEYYSPAADKPYLARLYADYFYDYLDRICDVYPGLAQYKPEREDYVNLVHNNNYDRHAFFRNLYDMEKAGTQVQAKEKQRIVRESIRLYLDQYAHTLNLAQLTEDIRQRQREKVFLLWNLREFVADSIREDEMELTHVERVKNNNTIVVMSKAGTTHNMLLRWKNHLGVLYPAWQISLTR
jgi:hypothetical protein